MLRTKFYLTDGKATGETALYAACYLEGVRKKVYLPTLLVRPDQWDAKGQKYRRNFDNYPEANKLLKLLADELEKSHVERTARGKTTNVDDLRAIAARVTAGAPPAGPAGLLEEMGNWIEASKRDKSAATIKCYVTLQRHLTAYAKVRRLQPTFASLDSAFCEGFKSYLLRTVGLGNASINNQVKNLKVFLAATFEQELHEFAHFKRFRKLEAVAPELVYLTRDEKEQLYLLNLTGRPYLEQTRDIFLFECETGLRFSDVRALRPEQIVGGYILLTTIKTADLLRVPLSPLAQSILARYAGRRDGKALPVISNQKTNAYLKVVAELAGLDTPTTTTQHKGSQRVATTRPKWELVCTHTARRTFVTLALEGGMRPEVVMRITGHKDYKTLHRYLKITDAVVQGEFEQYVERQAAPLMRAG
ncbi:site-specific integrase [Hymenobacter sp. J193]|uniref:site-specific integrase n=1 Tax=Hymenobacter sp. J193 TaxID=2898429 RepID=UPI0021508B30|nr:site-specific integrase [Hymenobacter sp. J193]MCR5889447.1 site-specific integrase [Hymenobacter sp. J193]